MSGFTDDKTTNLTKNLNYLGLDLKNLPEFLKEYKDTGYTVTRGYDDKSYKVYKYLPIDEIQILLTSVDREKDLKDRYTDARPIFSYLKPNAEDEAERHYEFLKIIENLSKELLLETEEEQKKVENEIPFRIKFKENYLWQIYYSNNSNMYFMLMPTKNFNQTKMLYLLKEQIAYYKNKVDDKKYIYVPITCLDYTEELLSKLQIVDLENYIMNFTGYWPQIYEVYDKDGNCSVCISGDANIYEGMTSRYKIVLKEKEEALTFFKLVKALFMMQKELYQKYEIEVRLNETSSLEFFCNNKKMTYDVLAVYIGEEYHKLKEKIEEVTNELIETDKKLKKLKKTAYKKEKEFFFKEKEVATFMQYKKTFFGRIRYYFKSKKKKEKIQEENENKEQEEALVIEPVSITQADFYTLDELKAIDMKYAEEERKLGDMKLDIVSLENKITNLEKKIANAKIYIEEIHKNSKSIFEFWKFTNKDIQELPEGESKTEETSNFKLKKVFHFGEDFEEFAQTMDVMLRKGFSVEELNSALILKECEVIEKHINLVKQKGATQEYKIVLDKLGEQDIKELKNSLEEFKDFMQKEQEKLGIRNFDIFGNIMENQSIIKVLGGKKHRENRKSVYKILNINSNTTFDEYIEKLNGIIKNLESGIKKTYINYDISLYKAYDRYTDFKEVGYEVYSININEMLKEEKKTLLKLHFKDDLQGIPYSNIIFYNNTNETLPIGMDTSTDILIDKNLYYFEFITKKEMITNNYSIEDIDATIVNTNKIDIYEYEVKSKKRLMF